MVIGILEPACAVQLYLNCTANLFFSTYDIDIYIDGKKADTLSHGKSKTVVWEMYKGAHTITVTKKENTSINGSATFTVTEDVKISYKIYCYSDRVDIQEESVESMRPLKQNEAKIPASSEEYGKMSFDEVSEQLKSAGFTNINGTVIRDLTGAWSEPGEGQIEKITIDGRANFSKYEIFNKDIEIKITYHEKILEKEELERRFSANRYESAEKTLADFENTGYTLIYMIDGKMTTNFSAEGLFFESGEVNTEERTVRLYFVSAEEKKRKEAKATPIPAPTSTPKITKKPESVSYSTNDKSTVKNGNSGVYAYKSRGGTYDNYYIIDFEEGFVYFFSNGNGGETCDKIEIVSGNLNDVVIIMYHDGEYTWQSGLHFKWKNQPNILVMEDSMGFEYMFYTTNLESALSIRDEKEIVDYSK